MSVREELRKRAAESTVAAVQRVSRCAVVTVLDKYHATRSGAVDFTELPEYIDEVEALEVEQPKELKVDFCVGEMVKGNGYPRRDGKIVGYEIRYLVKYDGLQDVKFGTRGDRLERVSPFNTIKPAPIPVTVAVADKWEDSTVPSWYNKFNSKY